MAARKLKELKTERGKIQKAVARFEKHVQALDENNIDVFELKDRREMFKPLLSEYNKIQDAIETFDETDFETAEEERDMFERQNYSIYSKVEKILLQIEKDSFPTSSSTNQTLSRVTSNFVRLPEINLPKFTGNYEEWYDFYNTFDSLINSNRSLQKTQKLQYLKSALTGEASEILSSLEITDSNYDGAWEMLKNRFDNKRIIINKHIQSILDLPTMQKENHVILRQVVDGVTKHMRILNSLGRPTESWDDIIIHIVTNKLDLATIKEWESCLTKEKLPSLKELTTFLTKRCEILETVSRKNQSVVPSNKVTNSSNQKRQSPAVNAHLTVKKLICSFCNKEHSIYNCVKFRDLTIEERIKAITSRNLCLNCLRKGHNFKTCASGSCRKCNEKHNTLIHADVTPEIMPEVTATHVKVYSSFDAKQVLLSTAIVNIPDATGNNQKCRAFLDSGFQSCFITRSFAKRLKLPVSSVNIPVLGINQTQTEITTKISVTIKSCYNAFKKSVDCLILDRITGQLPSKSINASQINIPKNIELADSNFFTSSPIDLLIGAELFWELICVGQINQGRNQPVFQKTELGWIASGHMFSNSSKLKSSSCNLCIDSVLNDKLTEFRNIEECTDKSFLSLEEKYCEEYFLNSYQRNNDGRFIVKIPFKKNGVDSLGESKCQAEKRLFALERKFYRNPSLKKSYTSFIHEYIELGHMSLVSSENNHESPTYYLPHHAVTKQTSLTTKLRVVFDGSAKSSTGVSINDVQMVGPVFQEDLFSIILRFRTHQYAMTADIAKMYRQVCINPAETCLQRILWRDNSTEEIKTYELSTVTYGTASAAYLAIRSLRLLAEIEINNYPLASEIALRDFYVDDLITSANSKEDAIRIQCELTKMLKKGGFDLRKWVSNFPDLVNNIPENIEFSTINLDKDQTVSTLGLQWNSHKDIFSFSQPEYNTKHKITNRKILSNISQIFDPLGMIGPVIIIAKLMMQQLWQSQITWDESVPMKIHTNWMQFEEQLNHLNALHIPRCVFPLERVIRVELHGFCDASEQAFGACIYVRATNEQNQHTSSLFTSKSRGAPLKNTSLPKLELCGALLLAKLMKRATRALNINIDRHCYWTDSTITLAWIKSTARNWKTFVANRVGEIQELSNPCDWFHVGTNENPADIISRRSDLATLIKLKLWWHGAPWLIHDYSEIISQSNALTHVNEIPERRDIASIQANVSNINIKDSDIFKFTQFSKQIRVVAYCLRFIQNTKFKNSSNKITGPLSTMEIDSATNKLLKIVHASAFGEDLNNLSKNKNVAEGTKLAALNPFLDDSGIIRVGGRLQNASIIVSQKHPIVLPKKHIFTKMLVEYEHVRNLHAAKPREIQPLMGILPQQRVTPARPFAQCGVDYFGPINIRENRKRNYKAYGAIFVCLATKAVHIELATDLTTETFLGAMKRFMARRGKPLDIFSGNGTNFVGANHELRNLRDILTKEASKNEILSAMVSNNVNWHFIPPRAPHFGGIWEAAVKSTKHQIRRVIGNVCLTYEETYTFLVQAEAVLNSRPLIPLSNDPNDYATLTPGHFLIGDLLTSNAEPDLATTAINRLSRWQHIGLLRQHFWSRWSKEYLAQLQVRKKWKTQDNEGLQPGQLVIIRDDNLPPLQWHMGRIEEVHPGQDGIVRAATVRSSAGTFKRPAVKLCPLPLE